jgi:protein pelota
MKIMHSDFRSGEVKVKTESLDDLWYLSEIVQAGDIIKGKTLRKTTSQKSADEEKAVERRPMFLGIRVESVEFHKFSDVLRIAGQICDGPEDVPHGSYHTFNVDDNTIISIEKKAWLKYEKDRLEEAASTKRPKIIICISDREEALFAGLKPYGYDILSEFSGTVDKKVNGILQQTDPRAADFFSQVIEKLGEYDKRMQPDSIILASPAFWKEEILKRIQDPLLKKKCHLATCSTVGKGAVEELLKRDEIREVLKQDRFSMEARLIEEIMGEIMKKGMAAYGKQEVHKAIVAGAVSQLAITDNLIKTSRRDGTFLDIEQLMKSAESMKGQVLIVSTAHEAGKRLEGLGGIAALLRYKLSY